jgi:hypothetical protein
MVQLSLYDLGRWRPRSDAAKGQWTLKILSPKPHLALSAKSATACSSRSHSTDLLALVICAWEQTGRESTSNPWVSTG